MFLGAKDAVHVKISLLLTYFDLLHQGVMLFSKSCCDDAQVPSNNASIGININIKDVSELEIRLDVNVCFCHPESNLV